MPEVFILLNIFATSSVSLGTGFYCFIFHAFLGNFLYNECANHYICKSKEMQRDY